MQRISDLHCPRCGDACVPVETSNDGKITCYNCESCRVHWTQDVYETVRLECTWDDKRKCNECRR